MNLKAEDLSAREREIVNLAAQGLTDKQIASEIGVQLSTIRTYWDRLKLKLGASNKTECVARVRILQQDHQEFSAFRESIEHIPALVVVTTQEGRFVHANGRWREFFGLETMPNSWTHLVHPEDLPQALAGYQRARKGGRQANWTVRFRRHDGQFRPHTATSALCHFLDAGPLWVGTAIEIEDDPANP